MLLLQATDGDAKLRYGCLCGPRYSDASSPVMPHGGPRPLSGSFDYYLRACFARLLPFMHLRVWVILVNDCPAYLSRCRHLEALSSITRPTTNSTSSELFDCWNMHWRPQPFHWNAMVSTKLPRSSTRDLRSPPLFERQENLRPQLTGLAKRVRELNISHASLVPTAYGIELADNMIQAQSLPHSLCRSGV